MNRENKLALLEEMLDMDKGSLTEDMQLSKMPQWDSMAAISLIALFDRELGKDIAARDIKNFSTVSDILKEME